MPPAGHVYRVRRLEADELGQNNPFKLVAEQGPDVRNNMAIQTIAVIGASFSDGKKGFYVLSNRADVRSGDPGAAEELLDHECRAFKHGP